MSGSAANLLYVLNDKLGGVASLNANLIAHQPTDGPVMPQHVVLLDRDGDTDARTMAPLGGETQQVFRYDLPLDNLSFVLKRLYSVLPPGPGLMISNEWLELAMCHLHDPGRTVLQIVHDEYNLGLAQTNDHVVDVFVAHSRHFHQRLLQALPHRRDRIFHLPYGVSISPKRRRPVDGPLRLVFIGRLSEGKGVWDLPVIDGLLRERDVPVTWTVIGAGPEGERLKREWPADNHLRYVSPPSNAEVLAVARRHDVFVLPTRFEGFPVALLEAMSVGLVPVVTDLPSGIPEAVTPDTGYRVPMTDCRAFADAIYVLHHDRTRLEAMSRASRAKVEIDFDLRERARSYHDLFARWRDFRRTPSIRGRLPYGSRLDRPWFPNPLVHALRASHRFLRGKRLR